MEMLEHRLVLSPILVTNTADSGVGSLRWAIGEANNTTGPDTIAFNIPTDDTGYHVDGTFVIKPLSPLPALSDSTGGTTVDGSTQTINTGDTNLLGPEIVLDGTEVSPLQMSASGLHLSSDSNQVHGLNIRSFTNYNTNGVLITGDANIVTGCFIGTDATGTEVAWNYNGITIQDASGNRIGGTADGAGNVISGNGNGIIITGDDPDENVIQGNRIGTDPTGSQVVSDGGTFANYLGISIGAGTNNLIGGTEPGAGNLISGFLSQGIWIDGSDATGTLMQGNRIGTNADGTEVLSPEGSDFSSIRGILIKNSANNVVGTGNVVSGNFFGIVLMGAGATGNIVRGSLVGTDPTGTIAVGNVRDGILIEQGASSNLIGGTTRSRP